MEVPFHNFLNFFTPPNQKTERGSGQAAEKRSQIGRFAGQEEDRAAEQPEIGCAAQKERGDHIEPQLPAPRSDGIEEQDCGGQEPEGQIQSRSDQRQPEPPPEGAEQVVGQPQRRAQQHGAQQRPGLVQQVYLHYRNSRARKPPRSPPPSS